MADPDELIDDADFQPFPTVLETLRQHCALLETELDDTHAELRACRQRMALLVVQHGNDANQIARQRTELVRLGWELSNARRKGETGQAGNGYAPGDEAPKPLNAALPARGPGSRR
jgi:hypothetical protein